MAVKKKIKDQTIKEIIAVESSGAQEGMVIKKDDSLDIEALLRVAMSNTVSVETIERLLSVRKELKAERAKEEYYQAMTLFQAECPLVVKTKSVKTKTGIVAYKFAPLESIVDQVRGLMQTHGFSYGTTMQLLPSGVRVSIRVTHVGGHTESSEMEVPLGGQTAVMSQTQVVAAAQTFAKRYAFCNAFGILTEDDDTDSKGSPKEKEQVCPEDHGKLSQKTVVSDGKNKGRPYLKCPACTFFKWVEEGEKKG